MPDLTSQKYTDLHAKAMKAFGTLETQCREERERCIEDRAFFGVAGAQWLGQWGEQYENKTKIEVNKVHLAVIRAYNQYLTNRISVTYASKSGDTGDQLADTMTGLFRASEAASEAKEAKDNGFLEALAGGMGAFRLKNSLEDEGDPDNEHQIIGFSPIYDADACVFFDPDAKLKDKSDAKYCFVLSKISHDAYHEAYDDNPASWPKDLTSSWWGYDWCTQDSIYLAEYYEVEHELSEVRKFEAADGKTANHVAADFESDELLESKLKMFGFEEVGQRKVRKKKVRKYILSGRGVLEDQGFIAGQNIPIVPIYGKRWVIDGQERLQGHVRIAKDPQRLINSCMSFLADILSTSPIKRPIFHPEQIIRHGQAWMEANHENLAYLVIDPLTDKEGNPIPSGPIGYTQSPEIPPALVGMLQAAEVSLGQILGNQEQGEKLMANASGKAIELVQGSLDAQTYIYIDNMRHAVQRAGEVWQSMAAEIFREPGRRMKSIGVTGAVEAIELKKMAVNDAGEMTVTNDLSKARFDVLSEAGPSSDSKRAALFKELMSLIQVTASPETAGILTTMAMSNMAGEGLAPYRDYFDLQMVRAGVLPPSKDQEEQLQKENESQKPDVNAQFLEASAEEAKAQAVKTMADAELSKAKTQDTKANTFETLAGIDMDEQQAALERMAAMSAAANQPAV